MPLLLNIYTATNIASVCITLNGTTLAFEKNEEQKQHASFLHIAIAEILKKAGVSLSDIEAFAVTSGPGSYTGLRVGMAAAKGFCYALSKPLITVNTLKVMTKAALGCKGNLDKKVLFCPLIDARRMEVFTAIYNADLEPILSPQAIILKEGIFGNYMINNKVLFFGSGSAKLKPVVSNVNGIFINVQFNAIHLGQLAETCFYNKRFTDVAHSEPTYFKDFYATCTNAN